MEIIGTTLCWLPGFVCHNDCKVITWPFAVLSDVVAVVATRTLYSNIIHTYCASTYQPRSAAIQE